MSPNRADRGGSSSEKEQAQPTLTPRGSSDDVRKRMDDMYAEMEQNWRSGHFHLPLKFVGFHKTEVMFLFVRAAIGYSLAFVKAKTLGKELLQALQDKKHLTAGEITDAEAQNNDQLQKPPVASPPVSIAERRERVARAVEAQTNCGRAMSAAYARLVLHCSNFEHHKEDERFFECVYFFVCSVVKLGIASTFWRPIEEELGFLFRGAQFSSNVKLHAAAAHKAADSSGANATESQDSSASTSSSSPSRSGSRLVSGSGGVSGNSSTSTGNGNASGGGSSVINGTGGAKKMQSLSMAKDTAARRDTTGIAGARTFQLPRSRVSHFAPSVPARRIVAELEATKSRAARNMELSQALRDRIVVQRGEERRRQLEAVTSPRQNLRLDALDAEVARASAWSSDTPDSAARTRPRGSLSARISIKSSFTTHSPVLNHLLPTTEERVRMALRDYEHELQNRREALRVGGGSSRRLSGASTGISDARASWLVHEHPRK